MSVPTFQDVERMNEKAEVGIVLAEDDDQYMGDVTEVLLVPIEKGGKRKCSSKVVVIETHEILESTLPLKTPFFDPSVVHASNSTAPCVSQQHS